MMRAFSGYLASNQLLALWDRILAYDSLEILSSIEIFSSNLIFIFQICFSSCRWNICIT